MSKLTRSISDHPIWYKVKEENNKNDKWISAKDYYILLTKDKEFDVLKCEVYEDSFSSYRGFGGFFSGGYAGNKGKKTRSWKLFGSDIKNVGTSYDDDDYYAQWF